MGKRYAPALANLYLVDFDEAANHSFHALPLHYFRYLDDVFGIWSRTLSQLQEYNTFLNSLTPDLTTPRQLREFPQHYHIQILLQYLHLPTHETILQTHSLSSTPTLRILPPQMHNLRCSKIPNTTLKTTLLYPHQL